MEQLPSARAAFPHCGSDTGSPLASHRAEGPRCIARPGGSGATGCNFHRTQHKHKTCVPGREQLPFKLVTSRERCYLLCETILTTFSVGNTALKILPFRFFSTLLFSLAKTPHFSLLLICFSLSLSTNYSQRKSSMLNIELGKPGKVGEMTSFSLVCCHASF